MSKIKTLRNIKSQQRKKGKILSWHKRHFPKGSLISWEQLMAMPGGCDLTNELRVGLVIGYLETEGKNDKPILKLRVSTVKGITLMSVENNLYRSSIKCIQMPA